MLEFFKTCGTQEQCEVVMRQWRWPEGSICPRCAHSGRSEFRRSGRLCFQCSGCRYQCSLVSSTIFDSTKLAMPKWFVAVQLITQAKNNVPALVLMGHIGVS